LKIRIDPSRISTLARTDVIRATTKVASIALKATAARLRAQTQAGVMRANVVYTTLTLFAAVPLIRIKSTVGSFLKRLRFTENPRIQTIMTYVLGRSLADNYVVTDVPDVVPNKSLSDAGVVGDFREPFQIGKGLFENPKVEEGDYFAEDYTTVGYTIVSFRVATTKPFSENPVVSDTLDPFQINKTPVDTVGITDDIVFARVLSIIDAPAVADSGVLRMQDYCDSTYFAEDYVGEVRNF
jgi:hypothetical protein